MIDIIAKPPTPKAFISGVAYDKTATHRETSDNYHRVVLKFSSRCRVIVCKDGIQWILQKREAEPSHDGDWRGKSYFACKESLIRVCGSRRLLLDPKARAVLDALPARISDYRK